MTNLISVRYLGHSCFEFDFNGIKVLTDPFVSFNKLAKSVDMDSLKPDFVFLSHAHQDHVADLLYIQKQSGAKVVSIVETAAWVNKIGVAQENIIEFNFGGTLQFPFGDVKMLYALHTNSTPDGNYGGAPCGYLFKIKNKKIYFAGDTALTMEMKLLEDEGLDWTFLPLGGVYTMDMYDAVKASRFVNCQNIIGMHYDTFAPIVIDKEEALSLFSNAEAKLHLLPIDGEFFQL